MKTFVYEDYKPACSCGWCQPEDTHYQIIDNEYVSLGVTFETVDGIYEAHPIPVRRDIPFYPRSISIPKGWVETHYCPICKKEYEYIVPCIIE